MTTILNRGGCGAHASQSRWSELAGLPATAQDFGDVIVWPQSETETGKYFYLPLAPSLNEGPDGLPHLGLLDPAGMGFFYATLQLNLRVERLELLRRELATEEDPVPHLSPAHIEVVAAEIVRTESDGEETVLLTRSPAPNPPHTAMLQFSVPMEAKPAMEEALMGHTGRIQMRYKVRRSINEAQTFILSGTFPEDILPETVDAALLDGSLTIEPAPKTQQQRDAVLQRAHLASVIQGIAPGIASLTVTANTSRVFPFDLSVDLGRAMAAHAPLKDPLPPE